VEWGWQQSGGQGRSTAPAAGGQSRARARGRRREGRGPGGLFGNLKNSRDFSVKQDFPLIWRFNEEMPKMKVGEFFKLYNIVLGLKFKNPKLIVLHIKF
jgi:hypothetical protein